MEGAAQVDGDHGVPALGGEILDARNVLDSGVVHQNVHPTKSGFCVADHGLDFIGLAHIGTIKTDLHAQRSHLGHRPVLVAKAVHDDVDPLRSKGLGHPEADAAGGAGDEGGFAFEHMFPGKLRECDGCHRIAVRKTG